MTIPGGDESAPLRYFPQTFPIDMKREVKISIEFQKQSTKAIFSILFFIIVYLLVLLLSLVLISLCIALSGWLVWVSPSYITGLFFIGLVSMGLLVCFFLVKSLFKTYQVDDSHLVEIHAQEQPQLFQMIEDLVKEIGTDFPQKVYLSSDVNAAVFYDSSFWSMFLPVKKNLRIGLGLVNTMSQEELRGILAHEFGHFSQQTLKLSSYVYYINQLIFNLLYENEEYENNPDHWSRSNQYLNIVVSVAFKIHKQIHWVWQKLYDFVNQNHLSLSREMEFHADEIAASVTGYAPLKSSLLRTGLADEAFNGVLSFYSNKVAQNLKSQNLYRDHWALLRYWAQENDLEMTHGLPNVSMDYLTRFDKSKLVIKDQWASHPTNQERISRLEQTGLVKDRVEDGPANGLFADIETLQQQWTERLFKEVTYSGPISLMSAEEFIETYIEEAEANSFSKCYNGYYDNKNPMYFELDQPEAAETLSTFESLFATPQVDAVYTSLSLNQDIEFLKKVASNQIAIKTFDYEGVKYKKQDAKSLVEQLSQQLDTLYESIKKNDIEIYHYFKSQEIKQAQTPQLEALYRAFFDFDQTFDQRYDLYNQLMNDLQFVRETTPFDQIEANFIQIKPQEERLQEEIRALLQDAYLASDLSDDIRQQLEKYTSQTWVYFQKNEYLNEHLEILFGALHHYAYGVSRKYFLIKKQLLAYQEELLSV
jgi:Zn-dependent protease with chaperone function